MFKKQNFIISTNFLRNIIELNEKSALFNYLFVDLHLSNTLTNHFVISVLIRCWEWNKPFKTATATSVI